MVEGLRVAAQVVSAFDGKQAVELLKKADRMEVDGPGNSASQGGREEAIKEWEAMCGVSMKNPEDRAKVYKVAAAMRRQETEAADAAAVASQKARDRLASVRKRRRR